MKSKGLLKEYFELNDEPQDILKTATSEEMVLTQNSITDNNISIIFNRNNSGNITLYNDRAKLCDTLNKNFEITSRYTDFNPVQIVNSFSSTRKNCELNKSNNVWYIREEIFIPNKVKLMQGCQFLMILFSFMPIENWIKYCSEGYCLSFKLLSSENIHNIQLQIKNSRQRQFVDYRLTNVIFKYKLSEMCNEDSWSDISEICFVIFAEGKFEHCCLKFETAENFV